MNDTGLVDDDRLLAADVCVPEDRALIREAAYAIRSLLGEFSYLKSPEFQERITGKSSAVAAMHRRLAAEPVRKKEHSERFEVALAALWVSDEAYQLAGPEQQASLMRLKTIVAAVRNPAL